MKLEEDNGNPRFTWNFLILEGWLISYIMNPFLDQDEEVWKFHDEKLISKSLKHSKIKNRLDSKI